MIKIINFFFLFAFPILSLDTIIVDELTEELNISTNLSYYLDDSKAWRIEEIAKLTKNFYPNKKSYLDLNFKDSSVWLHFRIKNNSKENLKYFITIPVLTLDHAEFFIPSPHSKKWISSSAGDTIPINKWSNPKYLHPTFEVEIPMQKEISCFLNLRSTSFLRTPIYLQNLEKKEKHENYFKLVERFLFFFMIILLSIAFYFYFKTQEKVLIFYILSVFSFYLNSWLVQGTGYKTLWPNSPELQNRTQLFFLSFSVMFSSYAMQAILKEKIFFISKIKNLLEIINFTLFCLAFLCFMGIKVQIRIYIFNIVFFVYIFVSIYLYIQTIKTKEKNISYYYFFIGIFSIFCFGILSSLFAIGILPYSFFYQYSVTLLSPIFFSVILYSLFLYSMSEKKSKQKRREIFPPLWNGV